MNNHRNAGIRAIVSEAIADLPDGELAAAVDKAFAQEQASHERIEACFERLTSRAWPRPTLERFFHGWRDTHLTSGSVAGIGCRLMLLAEREYPENGVAFFEAAARNARIIHEDLGLCGETHADLYERLATAVCDGDEWELRRNRVPSAFAFRKWVHRERVSAEDMQDGILTTIASEIYNHGEYSMIAPMFQRWLEGALGFSPREARRKLAYIMVHTGDTESDHFLFGIETLKHYCRGAGLEVDYERVSARCAEYLRRVGAAFDGIEARIN